MKLLFSIPLVFLHFAIAAQSLQRIVITDKGNNPIANATVIVLHKNVTKTFIADSLGTCNITATEKDSIEISCVGYKKLKTVFYESNRYIVEQATLDLKEVVVVNMMHISCTKRVCISCSKHIIKPLPTKIIATSSLLPSNTIKIYPNPAINSTTLTIKSNSNSSITYSIFNINGSLVQTTTVNAIKGNNQYSINCNNLIAGNFILKVLSNDKSVIETIRFVKM